MVRASSHKTIFDKFYMPNWTKEHFTVSKAVPPRKGTKRRVYTLMDYNDETVEGSWYPEEIKEISDNQYRIEKVLRRRNLPDGTKELFVRWEGWPDKSYSWIQNKQTSTMSSVSDQFQVLLPSNVKSNPRNKPNLYGTDLAKPLDLPGEWDVALINISYPHN